MLSPTTPPVTHFFHVYITQPPPPSSRRRQRRVSILDEVHDKLIEPEASLGCGGESVVAGAIRCEAR